MLQDNKNWPVGRSCYRFSEPVSIIVSGVIGRLLNRDGVVADQVRVTIARDYRRLDHLDGWRGEAWLSTASHVIPGDELILELNGGDGAPIVIERVTVDTKAGQMLIRFTGSGPLEGVDEDDSQTNP